MGRPPISFFGYYLYVHAGMHLTSTYMYVCIYKRRAEGRLCKGVPNFRDDDQPANNKAKAWMINNWITRIDRGITYLIIPSL